MSMFDELRKFSPAQIFAWTAVTFATIAIFMFGFPKYNVWQQGMVGRAELTRAEQNRQILIAQAIAQTEAAYHIAQAEIRRAHGVAEANKIIGDSLRNNEAYLRWRFIENLANTSNQIIYLPTEAGLPILEAGRFRGR